MPSHAKNLMRSPGKRIADARPSRILIVDDEAPQMRALCDTLKDQGYETTGFTRGENALEALKETKFELLLADLMMPGLDGIALLRAARQIDADLAGIIMTGEGTIATAVEAMKSGALDYILKPFKLSAILPVLDRALTVRRLRMENAELERSLRGRTVELEAANKELDAFSYSVAHDLRAPLRSIDGFSHALLEDYASVLGNEGTQYLAHIRESAQNMTELIDALLMLSRVSRSELQHERVDLSALAGDIVSELRLAQPDRQVETVIASGLIAEGDGRLLRAALENLFANAWKFTAPRDRPRVEFAASLRDGQPTYFIRDNGAGFDMAHAKKLFGVFQRLHSEQEFEGTGIGLATVQRIIHRHGGLIWAEGEVDRGATFYFTIGKRAA